jgi:hypothetical protein
MGTDECLHKLAPVMPERVRQWRRSLEVADATTRRLLEQHIASVAYQRLGDPDGLFLSLPPPERARGAYHLGTIRYDGPTWPLGLREEEVLQHVAIFGRSGAGKTNVLFHLLEQLTGCVLGLEADRPPPLAPTAQARARVHAKARPLPVSVQPVPRAAGARRERVRAPSSVRLFWWPPAAKSALTGACGFIGMSTI